MQWLYENSEDNSARFVLGQVFNPTGKTLLCFGINPSTACPENLDNTIRQITEKYPNYFVTDKWFGFVFIYTKAKCVKRYCIFLGLFYNDSNE